MNNSKQEDLFMYAKVRNFLFGGLVAGSLLASAIPAMARDYWHWNNNRWDRRADIRSDQHDLAQARRQLDWDRSHRASHRTIVQDETRISDIERDLREDRRLSHR
jgi:hypothetical protein